MGSGEGSTDLLPGATPGSAPPTGMSGYSQPPDTASRQRGFY
eukprot:CAMPEP_0206061312 /NCGR_PEP_ID=MMETSP1466-20131121/53807_1 /ASSEMBLY_ACC=CAM_ASM_001126 /TAXON_ID=44452 /ORGANISM="Pavlova gyrans, Strain CCMP608" /LENGTH=41 /DNA_ID= /DNA_START= /DNA_END= /DNA_ORIENTATION=